METSTGLSRADPEIFLGTGKPASLRARLYRDAVRQAKGARGAI
ncbi:protein of unknown function [Stenotrophomonas maltophilia]|nr:protein of unknown function [Stenotrophomonas maltophilia]